MKLEVRNHEVRSANELPGLPYKNGSLFISICSLSVFTFFSFFFANATKMNGAVG